ncbi:hypothetical protein GCM10017687_78440 [Streptomyces echinatus]
MVTAPFPAYPEYDAGPPVTEGAVVRVRDMDGSGRADGERAHRPRQVAAAREARKDALRRRSTGGGS